MHLGKNDTHGSLLCDLYRNWLCGKVPKRQGHVGKTPHRKSKKCSACTFEDSFAQSCRQDRPVWVKLAASCVQICSCCAQLAASCVQIRLEGQPALAPKNVLAPSFQLVVRFVACFCMGRRWGRWGKAGVGVFFGIVGSAEVKRWGGNLPPNGFGSENWALGP